MKKNTEKTQRTTSYVYYSHQVELFVGQGYNMAANPTRV